jgi:hypothetical protein
MADNTEDLISEWDLTVIYPFEDTNLYGLLSGLAAAYDDIDEAVQDLLEQRHVETATGRSLELLGDLADVSRQSGESDDKYRKRIVASFRAGLSGATFEDLLSFLEFILEIDGETIEISQDTGARASVNLPSNAVTQSPLTSSEITQLSEDVVPAGHTISLVQSGTFEVKADGTANDPDKGLTSDSISTGGTLSQDI